uniref:Uncharacterized protein n=1 Tax=Panagrellus redivivus TaxID=6233 RepID=A0A7E4UWE0_PANRE
MQSNIPPRQICIVLVAAILFLGLFVDSEAAPHGMTRIQNLFRTLMGPKNDVPIRGKKFVPEFPGSAYYPRRYPDVSDTLFIIAPEFD